MAKEPISVGVTRPLCYGKGMNFTILGRTFIGRTLTLLPANGAIRRERNESIDATINAMADMSLLEVLLAAIED
jgi:hypothetical protein